MVEILTDQQLKRLTEHKYSVSGTSLVEPVMQKFWRWLVEQIPLWWAPNAITLVGLIINLFTTVILIIYSPDAKQEVPSWCFYFASLGLFMYQCLDAIDGKQARRTKSNTPLGELFDHGCDSVSTAFVIIGASIALQLGQRPGLMFFEVFASIFMFYAAHWQTYVSGTLKFGIIDVTEAQFCVMGVYTVSGLLGTGFWNTPVPVLGIELRLIPVSISIFAAMYACSNYFRVILMQGGSGKNGSTIAGTSVLSPLPPLVVIYLLAIMIWQKSTTGLYENNPCLYLASFSMVTSKITNKLVIAHMTKSEMSVLDTVLIGPALLFLNQYFNEAINEYYVLWACLIYSTLDFIWFTRNVCIEICDYLEIFCFSIERVTSEKTSSDSNHSGKNKTNGQSTPGTRRSTRLTNKQQ